MKCKRDVVVGTHPEDIASYFFFHATGDQTNLNSFLRDLDFFQTGGV